MILQAKFHPLVFTVALAALQRGGAGVAHQFTQIAAHTREDWKMVNPAAHLVFALHPADPDVVLVGLPRAFLPNTPAFLSSGSIAAAAVNAATDVPDSCSPCCRTSRLPPRCPAPLGKGRPWRRETERGRVSGRLPTRSFRNCGSSVERKAAGEERDLY